MSHGRGFKGSKYESGRDVKEVAKLVRKDLKAEFGKGYKFSVRISRYAGGQSLTVELVAVPGPMPFYSRERALADERGEVVREPFRSPELAAIVERMDKVVTAYHFDDSDSMTDYWHVNFYKHVEVASALMEPDRLAAHEEARAKLAAEAEAEPLAEVIPMTPPATVPTLEPDGTVGERPYEGSGREALQKAHKAYAWAEPKKVALPTPVASPYFVEVEFPKVNKQCSLEDNDRSCTDWGSQVSRVKVVEEMALTPTEYEVFAGTLLASRPEHFEDKGGAVSDEDFPEGDYFSWGEADRERFKRTCYTQGILVRAPGKADLVVNPEGYAYARYVGRVVKPKAEPKPDAFDKWAPARAGFKCARWGEA